MAREVILKESDVWYSKSIEETIKGLESSKEGLSSEESHRRLLKFGKNQIPHKKKTSLILKFLKQFNNPLIYVLWVAILISLFIRHYVDMIVIFAMILANAIIGFVQEKKAENAIAALKKLIISYAKVYRNGELVKVNSQALAPGDVIFIEEGDKIPADARIIEMKDFRTQEASLTGESLPKEKELRIFEKRTSLAERKNMVYMGTVCVSGTARAVVVETGRRTEIGKVAKDIEQVIQPKSHYNKKVRQLTILVSVFAIVAVIVEFLIGFLYDKLPFSQIFLFGIASLVSGIPEGLPAALAIVLAIGARRMAKRKAVIRYLPAIDTLGVTTVIATDKTGTITENSMVVEDIVTSREKISVTGDGWIPLGRFLSGRKPISMAKDEDLRKVLSICALCNNGTLLRKQGNYEIIGDPTEVALLVLGRKAGFDKEEMENSEKVLDDLPFSSELKFRASLVDIVKQKKKQVYAVGAFESIMERSSHFLKSGKGMKLDKNISKDLLKKAEAIAKKGKRVLALAYRDVPQGLERVSEENVKGMIIVGFVGMQDPPRKKVKEAIMKARRAGIRVIMKTGDNKETALAIAKEIGLAGKDEKVLTEEELESMNSSQFRHAVKNINIFARVTPKMKLRIVQALQEQGEVVAMTGDGVNDAPALKRADVGVAMGKTGTDVARESSEMILMNDDFASIVSAIEHGRVVFQNIRKTSFFLVSTGTAEDLTVVSSMALSFPLILLPVHFLYLNLVTTGFTSVSLAMEPEDEDVLAFKPRNRKEGILNKKLIIPMIITGVLMAVGTLLMFHVSISQGLEKARTMAFATMSMFELFQVYNMRSIEESLFKIGPFKNKWVNFGVLASIGLMAVAFYVPFIANVIGFAPLSFVEILEVAGIAFTIIPISEGFKFLRRRIRHAKSLKDSDDF